MALQSARAAGLDVPDNALQPYDPHNRTFVLVGHGGFREPPNANEALHLISLDAI
jgi:hypothetical protein